MLLGVSQTFNCIRYTDDQSVIAVCSVLAVYRIGGCEIISLSFFIISNARIRAFLDQRFFRLCKVRGASDGSSDGILHAFSCRVGFRKIIAVPADGVCLLLAV